MKSTIPLFVTFIFLISCNTKNDQDYSHFDFKFQLDQATALYQQNEYKGAIDILEKLLNRSNLNENKKEQANIYYDLACNYSLIGNKKKALDYLEESILHGYANFKHLQEDSDFDLIRENPKFKNLIRKLKQEQSLWENDFMNTPYRENISETEKIAGLSKLWSEIKFNFINFDLVPEINIDSLYLAYLPKIQETRNTYEYYLALQEFCVHFQDGHTEVIFPKELNHHLKGRVPIQTRLVENKLIITKLYDESLSAKGLKPGIEITHIDNLETQTYVKKFIQPYWTSNSKHGKNRTIFEYALLRGPIGKNVKISCKMDNEDSFTVELPRLKYLPIKWEPVSYKEFESNIGYVKINSFYADKIVKLFDSVFTSIESNEALIIDLRENGGGNGRVGWTILGYFTNAPFQIFNWESRLYRPIWRAWGRSEETFTENNQYRFYDSKKYYSKPVVILTRSRTASMAENFCMGFKIMKRGNIIGEPTSGSSGTPLFFSLPGGGKGKVVTTRSTFPDGVELIGKGVEPDIKVSPRIEDFKNGNDPILNTAIQYLVNIK